MQVPVKDLKGTEVEQISLNDALFGVPMNKDVVYQALQWQNANTHLGTVDTKTRSEVSGSTRKPWRQKHTGRARAGTARSPIWRHGGIVFGPHQRSFKQALPRKMRHLALRCLLSDKRATGDLIVIKDFNIGEKKTKTVVQALSALDIQSTALLVMRDPDIAVVRAARNIEGLRTLPSSQLNAADLLNYRYVIMTVDAVRQAEELWSTSSKRGAGAHPAMASQKPAAPAKPKAEKSAVAKAPAAKPAAKPKAEAKPKAAEHKTGHKAHDAKAHETKAEDKPKRTTRKKATE